MAYKDLEKSKENKRRYYIENKEILKKKNKKYYEDNKDKINAQKREYNIINAEKMSADKKKYRLKNIEKLRESARLNRLSKIEIYNARDKAYRKAHPEVILKSNIKALKNLGKYFQMDRVEYARAVMSWRYVNRKIYGTSCAVCKSDHKVNVHHIFQKAVHPELSLNKHNGIPLCKEHHLEVHRLNPMVRA